MTQVNFENSEFMQKVRQYQTRHDCNLAEAMVAIDRKHPGLRRAALEGRRPDDLTPYQWKIVEEIGKMNKAAKGGGNNA